MSKQINSSVNGQGSDRATGQGCMSVTASISSRSEGHAGLKINLKDNNRISIQVRNSTANTHIDLPIDEARELNQKLDELINECHMDD